MDTIGSLHIGKPVLADLVQQPVCNLDEFSVAEEWRVWIPSERHAGWPLSGLASRRHERHGDNGARPKFAAAFWCHATVIWDGLIESPQSVTPPIVTTGGYYNADAATPQKSVISTCGCVKSGQFPLGKFTCNAR